MQCLSLEYNVIVQNTRCIEQTSRYGLEKALLFQLLSISIALSISQQTPIYVTTHSEHASSDHVILEVSHGFFMHILYAESGTM